MSLPVSAFSTENYPDRYRFLRFSFCVDDESMKISIKNMKNMRESL